MIPAQRFLTALYAPVAHRTDLRVELRSVQVGRGGGGPSIWYPLHALEWAAATAQNRGRLNSGWDLYFGVAPRLGHGRRDADCPLTTCLFADVDGGPGGQQAAVELLQGARQAGLPRPNIAVLTGGGVHAYWLLADPMDVETDDDRREFRAMERRLCMEIGGTPAGAHADEQATNISRVLRLPGTYNNKPTRLCEVRMCRFQPEAARYTWGWWDGLLPRLPVSPERAFRPFVPSADRPLPDWVYRWAHEPAPAGAQNREFCKVAAWLRRDYKLGRDALLMLLESKADRCVPRPTQKRIEEIARWA